jgi:methyl-accepting chemotaxis protein
MSIIANMKIMTKLLLGFIIVAAIAGAVGFFGVTNLLKLDKMDTILYEENVIGILSMAKIKEAYLEVRLNGRRIVTRNNKDSQMKDLADSKKFMEEYEKYAIGYEKTISVEEDRIMFNDMKEKYKSYIGVVEELEKGVAAGKDNNELQKILSTYAGYGDQVGEIIHKLFEFNVKQAKERSDLNTATASKAITTMILLVIGAVILSIVLGTILALAISRPINKLAEAGKKLAIGDINIDIKSTTTDEIGILTKSFEELIEATKEQANIIQKIADGDISVSIRVRSESDIVNKKIEQMLNTNNSIFGEIRKAAEQVNSAAEQVAQGSTALAQASTEQSATVEEITATVEEIASQSKENASGARSANELASEARVSSETGSTQMKNMMHSMEEINEASRSISKIIKVIDDIAFQTNILALNAAVEAARAGSHGKGFAVVAEEVRNLAARSAKAASETTDLIESTIAKVNTGTKIATETADALSIINEKIGKVTGMIEEIATSSGEQATAVAQVSLAVTQVSAAIQTNSATAEESAAASEELSAQSTLLKQSVAIFRLKDSHRGYIEKEERGIKEAFNSNSEFGDGFGKY